jgi:hypothetical protein
MVITVRVVITVLAMGVTDEGANVQLAPEGSPVQVNETAWLKPLMGVTVSAKAADRPCLIVAEVGDASTV